MQPIRNMSHEQVQAIERAYPHSMNPILSFKKDCDALAGEARQAGERARVVAKLAERLASDFMGQPITASLATEIASRALDCAEEEAAAHGVRY